MKKKQFDAQTAKKIINEYANQINLLSRENKVLKKQLEDSKISLQINKEILYSHIKSKKNASEECDSIIADLKKEKAKAAVQESLRIQQMSLFGLNKGR